MADTIAQRWQLPEPLADGRGNVVAGVGPEVVLFGELDDAGAEALAAAAGRWRDRFGDRATWRNEGTGRWRKAGTRFWTAALGKIAGFADDRPHSFGVISDPYDEAPAGPAIDLFAADGTYTLRWIGDRAEDEAAYREDLDWLIGHVPCRWGYAGAGVYGEDYSDATGGRADSVGQALQRWPLLGMSHPDLWGVPEDGVTTIGWCTVLGAQLASRPRLRSSQGVTVRSVGKAVSVELDVPPLSEEMPPTAKRLWTKLAAVQAPEAARAEGWIPGLTLEDMRTWSSRFA